MSSGGIEPPTCRLRGGYSADLSYELNAWICNFHRAQRWAGRELNPRDSLNNRVTAGSGPLPGYRPDIFRRSPRPKNEKGRVPTWGTRPFSAAPRSSRSLLRGQVPPRTYRCDRSEACAVARSRTQTRVLQRGSVRRTNQVSADVCASRTTRFVSSTSFRPLQPRRRDFDFRWRRARHRCCDNNRARVGSSREKNKKTHLFRLVALQIAKSKTCVRARASAIARCQARRDPRPICTNWKPKRPLMQRCPLVTEDSTGEPTFTIALSCTCSVTAHPTPQ
jgi:hypothetical protein